MSEPTGALGGDGSPPDVPSAADADSAVTATDSKGTYVFGIVAADHPCQLDELTGVGAEPEPVRRVVAEPVAAVVGAAPPRLRAKRRDLAAHHRVLTALAEQGTVLPMRFGVVAPDDDALREQLREAADRYLSALREIAGAAEYNVKLLTDEDAVVRRVADTDPAVLRERGAGDTGYEGRVRLGQAVATAVEAALRADADRLVTTLTPLARRTAPAPPTAGAAVNASFLVTDEQLEPFQGAVHELAHELRADGEVRCTGPLPPYSFVPDEGGEP
ncbi:GvpL/GvpF family gas vesicle protein [Actinocatenispora sera]|uniref:GvpL/GvpF family gas vesicle protein n=1 Tax=Actinocatenispora sera TaxID=390989 RepID=UPI0033D1C565